MKFNVFNLGKGIIKNFEKENAYNISPEMELFTLVVTSLIENTFYEKADERIERMRRLIKKTDPVFCAKLAIYTRQKMHLRTVPILLSAELAKVHNGDGLVSKMLEKVIQRPDEILEILSCYQRINLRDEEKKLGKLSKQIQKGLALSFNKFDEYQFAKYNCQTEIKFKDALFLVHPKAKSIEQQSIFNKIVNDNLSTPYTWESELSALGKRSFTSAKERNNAFKAKWEELITSEKIGYMALLRNLRNILEAEVSSEHIEKLCVFISEKEAVLKSKQLPMRYLSAYRELLKIKSGYTSLLLESLEKAIRHSAENIRGFDIKTKVVIACDVSGSMQIPVSSGSKILLYDIGLLLAMLLHSKCKNVVSGMFGDTWKIIQLPPNGVLVNVTDFYKREGEVGYSTNGHLVLKDLINRSYVTDKVMLFTDLQLWNSQGDGANMSTMWKSYKKIAPEAKLYLFDLSGYGNVPLKIEKNDVYLIAGWSDKIFDVLASLEDGKNVLSEIHNIII